MKPRTMDIRDGFSLVAEVTFRVMASEICDGETVLDRIFIWRRVRWEAGADLDLPQRSGGDEVSYLLGDREGKDGIRCDNVVPLGVT